MIPPIYTVKSGASYQVSMLLPDSALPITITLGQGTLQQICTHVNQKYPGAVLVKSKEFEKERESRLVHSPELVALLKSRSQDNDLTQYHVYGSRSRPLDTTWVFIKDGVFLQNASSDYYTLVAVPEVLHEEYLRRYDLILISHPMPDFDHALQGLLAKQRATDPLTLEYIQRLEDIARAAWKYRQDPSHGAAFYAALDRVNFLNQG